MAKFLILAPLLLSACTTITDDVTTGAPQTEYSAVGQEPGWTLRIDRDRITYAGDYGVARISVARPIADVTTAGRRYVTSRLVVDIVPGACRDAMSGSGFADVVIVGARGRTVRGCGGDRLVERDD